MSGAESQQEPVDAKAAFYFRHREQIEEWAALRQGARRLLEDALVVALQGLVAPEEDTLVVSQGLVTGAWPRVGLQRKSWLPADGGVLVSLGWNRGQLLSPTGSTWPFVGLLVPTDNGMPKDEVAALRAAVRSQAVELGWTRSDAGWAWWQAIAPEPGELDVAGYVGRCLAQLLAAWPVMGPAVTAKLG